MQVPLFPLNTVLFPGGPLPLRIFEARYVDMISERMRNDGPFGVVLIKEGPEAAGPATTEEVGTLARIIDFYQGSDGLLGVTAVGEQRFRLLSAERQSDGLNLGEIELLPGDPAMPVPDAYRGIADILSGVLDDLGRLYESTERRYDDAGWLGYRFLEILPIELDRKQACLELNDPIKRLEYVVELLESVKQPGSEAS